MITFDLQNAMRATIENHEDSYNLPAIQVTVALGGEDLTIKVSHSNTENNSGIQTPSSSERKQNSFHVEIEDGVTTLNFYLVAIKMNTTFFQTCVALAEYILSSHTHKLCFHWKSSA